MREVRVIKRYLNRKLYDTKESKYVTLEQIAEMIKEKEGKENYIVGGEESFGIMIGDKVRDKDAVSAVAMICEMAAVAKKNGQTLFNKLIDLYVQNGFYKEDLISITKKGMNGSKEIADMMKGYRDNPPVEIAGSRVTALYDYDQQVKKTLKTGFLKQDAAFAVRNS